MSQSILVLGASGYIGQHLVRELSARGYPVLAAARHIDRLQKLDLPDVTCHAIDLNQPQDLPALLRGVDTLYYLVHGMGKAAISSPMNVGSPLTCAMPCVRRRCAR